MNTIYNIAKRINNTDIKQVYVIQFFIIFDYKLIKKINMLGSNIYVYMCIYIYIAIIHKQKHHIIATTYTCSLLIWLRSLG